MKSLLKKSGRRDKALPAATSFRQANRKAPANEGCNEKRKNGIQAIMKAPMSLAEVRKVILDLVNTSAPAIALGLVGAAKEGQVAPAKYLFEVCGLFPVGEETAEKQEDSLAYTLLKRMGLPTEPEAVDRDI
jgi:hypothetical protein